MVENSCSALPSFHSLSDTLHRICNAALVARQCPRATRRRPTRCGRVGVVAKLWRNMDGAQVAARIIREYEDTPTI